MTNLKTDRRFLSFLNISGYANIALINLLKVVT